MSVTFVMLVALVAVGCVAGGVHAEGRHRYMRNLQGDRRCPASAGYQIEVCTTREEGYHEIKSHVREENKEKIRRRRGEDCHAGPLADGLVSCMGSSLCCPCDAEATLANVPPPIHGGDAGFIRKLFAPPNQPARIVGPPKKSRHHHRTALSSHLALPSWRPYSRHSRSCAPLPRDSRDGCSCADRVSMPQFDPPSPHPGPLPHDPPSCNRRDGSRPSR